MAEEFPEAAKRKLAIDLFNQTWTYMTAPVRTPVDDDAMLATAYASAHFWLQIGSAVHFARSHWQISRVYAILGRPKPALHHAQRCLDICVANDIVGWDRPFAYEALARGHAVAGDAAASAAALAQARELGAKIEEKGDRDYLFSELATIVVSAAI